MGNTNGPGDKKPDGFFAGKGFYIVLFLCAAVIGVSAWTLASGKSTVLKTDENDTMLEEPYNEEAAVPATQAPAIGDSELWEVPEDAQEVLAEPEAPETVSEGLSQPQAVPETEQASVAPEAFIWPVVGAVEMPYSVEALLYDVTMADWRTHDGIDVAGELGQKVMAAASGKVTEVYDDDLYGTTVVIDHGGGLVSVYANLAEVPTVEVGDAVLGGETIGAIGTTALCEAGQTTHLHFAMRLNGESVDPGDYLPAL